MPDTNSDNPDVPEVMRPSEEEQTSHLLSTEETPSSGDTAPVADSSPNDELREMEPSLQLYPETSEAPVENTQPGNPDAVPLGDDIDFPASSNSPELPGASMLLSHWDARESVPQSPRSEYSSHSSFYAAGSTRTSNAGGPEPPRSLIRSRDPKADLSNGDVVMLMYQGRPYIAIQARLPYKDDALHTCLELAEEGSVPESEALSYLEVVKQGPFVGFRSGAAANRFMQPRRRAPHRLVFFNQNFGVWEQWDVLGEDWQTTPWSTLQLVLRSRRLPHVQIAVDVVRVGYFTSPGTGGPRSLLPMIPEDPLLEDRNLRRISNLLVMEWFKFVDHEKLLREGLGADMAALADETQELKLKTIQQVEYLRLHMNEEMASLSHHVALRDDAIANLRRWLRRAQQLAADRMARQRHRRILFAWRYVVDDIVFRKAAILKLRRKRENNLREAAFRSWSAYTGAVVAAAIKLKFAVQRRSHMVMSRVLLGWQRAVTDRAWRGRTMLVAVQRRAARRLSNGFAAWRQLTAQRALGRRALLRSLHGVNMRWLAAALTAWRAAAQAVHQKTVQADLLVARRATRLQASTLDAWRNQVLRGRAADRHARAALARKALTAWRQATTAMRAAQAAVEAMAMTRPAALRRHVLMAWQAAAAASVALRARLNRHVLARSAALQGRALAGWVRAVRESRRRRVLLQRHLAALGLHLASAVLGAWRALAARTSWRRVRVIAALGRASTRRLAAAMVSWHAHASKRRAIAGRSALAAARLHRMRLAACLGAWHQLATRLDAARCNILLLCKKLLTCTLSTAFREWRLLTAAAAASRSAVARALPMSTRELLSHVLATWWIRHCAVIWTMDGDGLVPLHSAVAIRSAAAGGTSVLSSGYAAASASAAAAAVRGRAVISAAATPRQSLSQVYETAVRTSSSLPLNVGAGGSTTTTMMEGLSLRQQVGEAGRVFPGRYNVEGMEADFEGSPFSAQGRLPAGTASAPPTAARPPAHLQSAVTITTTLGPSPPLTAMPLQRGPRGSSNGSGAAAAVAAAAAAAAAVAALAPQPEYSHTHGPFTPPLSRGRTYREALVTGAAAAAAAAAAASSSSPTSAGRLRSTTSAGGVTGPFVPANAAVIGAGSSPVLIEMAPGRGGDGPLTPVGLPELLEGGLGIERSMAAEPDAMLLVAGEAGGEHTADASASLEAVAAAVAAMTLPMSHPLQLETLQELRSLPAAEGGEHGMNATPAVARTLGFAEGVEQHELRTLASSGLSVARQHHAAAGRRAAAAAAARSNLGRWLAASVLLRWRRAVAARREWMACLEDIGKVRRRKLASEVLGSWWQLVVAARAAARAAEALASQAKARSSRQIQRGAMILWRTAARRQAAHRALLARQLARFGSIMARRVLVAWRGVATGQAGAKRKVQRCMIRRERAVLSGALRAFREEAAAGAARRAAASQLADSQARGLLTNALQGWSGAAAVKRERATRHARAARFAERRRLVGAFRVWRWAAEAANEREAAAMRASRASALRTAFGGWLCVATESNQVGTVDLVASLRRATTWRERRLMKGSLRSLMEHKEQQLELKSRAVEYWRRSTKGAVLAAWRVEVAWRRWGQQEVERIRARTAHRIQTRCLSSWMSLAEVASAGRLAAEQLAVRREQTLLAEVLSDWQVAAKEVAAGRARVAACARRIDRCYLKRVVASWHWMAAQRHARRIRKLVACRRMEGQRMRRVLAEWATLVADLRAKRLEAERRFTARSIALLSAAFAGWAGLAQLLRAARAAAMTRGLIADRALLGHALDCWLTAVAQARRAVAAAAAMAARRSAAVLPATMRAWAAVACEDETRRLQAAALRNLMHRRRMAFARRIFVAWHGVVLEHQARDDELRRCIKRKKLAFLFYKDWYWDSFDSVVQATMCRLFHNTDAAAHSPEPSSRVPPELRQPPSSLHQSLPAYLVPHQQWVSRRFNTSQNGPPTGRSTDLPPPLELLELREHQDEVIPAEAAACSSRGAPAAEAQSRLRTLPAGEQRPLPVQQQLLRSDRGSAGRAQPPSSRTNPSAQVQQYPSPALLLPEAVRTLQSTFDAVAGSGARARGPRPAAATAAVATPSITLGPKAATTTAAGSSRPTAPRSQAYPALHPSDSSGSDPDDSRNLPTVTKPTATAPEWRRNEAVAAPSANRATRPAGRPETSSAGTTLTARKPSAGTAAQPSTGSKTQTGANRTTSAVAAANARRSISASSAPAGRRHPMSRTAAAGAPAVPSSPTAAALPSTARSAVGDPAATAVAAAAAAAAAAAPSLEAMSAALNVAIRSLDLADRMVHGNSPCAATTGGTVASAGVFGVNSTPAGGPSSLPSRYTISSVSSGGPSYATDASPAAAHAAGGSPLSPPPRAPFYAAHGDMPGSGGGTGGNNAVVGGLPGVVPSWRQVANNQLYSCEEEWYGDLYDGDLGPVHPIYLGIAGPAVKNDIGVGAGAGMATAGVVVSQHASRRGTGDDTDGVDGNVSDMSSQLVAALSVRSLLADVTDGGSPHGGVSDGGTVSGNGSAIGSRRISSDEACSGTGVFPRHSIFQNAVYQPRTSELREGAQQEGGLLGVGSILDAADDDMDEEEFVAALDAAAAAEERQREQQRWQKQQ